MKPLHESDEQGRDKQNPLSPPEGGWALRSIHRAKRFRIVCDHFPAVRDGAIQTELAGFILHIGVCLLANLNDNARSASSLDERERLKDIAKIAKKLAGLLRNTTPAAGLMSYLMRRRPAHGSVRIPEIAELATAVLPCNRTTAATLAFSAPTSSPNEHALELLADAARHCEAELSRRARGAGRARLHQRLHGDPRLELCQDCAALLLRYCGPQAAPATEDGPVFRLACAIWEASTGQPAVDAGLENFTKQGVKRAKNLQISP